MEKLLLQVSENDKEILGIVEEQLSSFNVTEVITVKSFDGTDVLINIVIPLLPLTYQIIQDYFVNPNPATPSVIIQKRKLIIKKRKITLIGYTGDELEKILPKLEQSKIHE